MKVGDLVTFKSGYQIQEIADRIGIIIDVEIFGESGSWLLVCWPADCLWHRPGDLELYCEA